MFDILCIYIYIEICKKKDEYRNTKLQLLWAFMISSSSNLLTLAFGWNKYTKQKTHRFAHLKYENYQLYWAIKHHIHFSCFDTQLRYLVDLAFFFLHSRTNCDQRSFPRLTKGSRSHAFKASSSLTMSLGSKAWRLQTKIEIHQPSWESKGPPTPLMSSSPEK